MVALVQRVSRAAVEVDGRTVGTIGEGLLILLGVHSTDTRVEMEWVAKKCVNLRIFSDEAGKMNRSLVEIGGEALVVSQFTLYGNTRKGNRPSFVESAPPALAETLYHGFIEETARLIDRPVSAGIFGASMKVDLVNEGPVTLWVEKKAET